MVPVPPQIGDETPQVTRFWVTQEYAGDSLVGSTKIILFLDMLKFSKEIFL
jgi:hypothetical protein